MVRMHLLGGVDCSFVFSVYLLLACRQVWDLREGQLFYTLHGHEGAALGTAFSPAGNYFASSGADEQVMVWKTNFDRYLEDYTSAGIGRGGGAAAAPAPGAEAGLPPAPAPRAAPAPPPPAAAGPVQPVPARPAPVPAAQEASFSAGVSPSAALAPGSGPSSAPPVHAVPRPISESPLYTYEYEVPPPLNLSDLPESLAATLQHMVGQLDVLTQTLALMDERLTRNEDLVQRLDDKVDALAKMQLGGGGGGGQGQQAGSDTAVHGGGADQGL